MFSGTCMGPGQGHNEKPSHKSFSKLFLDATASVVVAANFGSLFANSN